MRIRFKAGYLRRIFIDRQSIAYLWDQSYPYVIEYRGERKPVKTLEINGRSWFATNWEKPVTPPVLWLETDAELIATD